MAKKLPQPTSAPAKKPKTRIVGKILLLMFLTSIIWSLIRNLVANVREGNWGTMVIILATLALFGLIAYLFINRLLADRDQYRQRFLAKDEHVRLRDAMLYALSFSREIYRTIPHDRKKVVKFALFLIGIPFLFMAVQTEFDSIATFVLNTLLVLAGINLLIWVVASEREEKERLRFELDTARRMQMALMPAHAPQLPGYEIAGICLPARSVGGDHFDYIWLGREKTRLGIAVVDVSGKGMDAAMTAIYTSGAFISEAQHGDEPAPLMRNLNSTLRSRHDRKRFVSFFFSTLDTSNRTLSFINAGQCHPLLYRDGTVSALAGVGPRFPLGTKAETDYQPATIELRSGDQVLLYTDGVPDAENDAEQVFGTDRLQEIFARTAHDKLSAEQTVETIRSAVNDFAGAIEQYDDITVVALQVQ
jgi:serine phosphatase RsbU (regulator of sigma subunit)